MNNKKIFFYTDLDLELFQRDGSAYSETMKKFALTLSLYGSKAYNFARTKFPLPCYRTLQRYISFNL